MNLRPLFLNLSSKIFILLKMFRPRWFYGTRENLGFWAQGQTVLTTPARKVQKANLAFWNLWLYSGQRTHDNQIWKNKINYRSTYSENSNIILVTLKFKIILEKTWQRGLLTLHMRDNLFLSRTFTNLHDACSSRFSLTVGALVSSDETGTVLSL